MEILSAIVLMLLFFGGLTLLVYGFIKVSNATGETSTNGDDDVYYDDEMKSNDKYSGVFLAVLGGILAILAVFAVSNTDNELGYGTKTLDGVYLVQPISQPTSYDSSNAFITNPNTTVWLEEIETGDTFYLGIPQSYLKDAHINFYHNDLLIFDNIGVARNKNSLYHVDSYQLVHKNQLDRIDVRHMNPYTHYIR